MLYVIAKQKAKADYASSQNKSLTEQLEIQEKKKLDSQGITNEQRSST